MIWPSCTWRDIIIQRKMKRGMLYEWSLLGRKRRQSFTVYVKPVSYKGTHISGRECFTLMIA
jgi:hypothetical protein